MMALIEVFNLMFFSKSAIFTANYFNMLKGNPTLELGYQQDSNEFLINVSDSLYSKKNTDLSINTLIANCPFNIIFSISWKCIMSDCTRYSQTYN